MSRTGDHAGPPAGRGGRPSAGRRRRSPRWRAAAVRRRRPPPPAGPARRSRSLVAGRRGAGVLLASPLLGRPARSRSTASPSLPADQVRRGRRHRPRARRCCGSTSTPPGRGSPGCRRSPRSRSPAAGRTPCRDHGRRARAGRGRRRPGAADPGGRRRRAVRHGHRRAAGRRRAARRRPPRARTTRPRWRRWPRSTALPARSADAGRGGRRRPTPGDHADPDRRHARALGRRRSSSAAKGAALAGAAGADRRRTLDPAATIDVSTPEAVVLR